MNLSQLYYFRYIVEEGSFSKAAERHFVSRSTLSSAVTALEKRFGCPLLSKKRMGVVLTEEGEELYQAALTATNAIDRCTRLLDGQALEEYAHVKIGMVYSIQSDEWSSLLRTIRHAIGHDVRFDLFQSTTEVLLRDLLAGRFDIVFTGTLPEVDSRITMVPSYSQRAILAVNKEHPLATRAVVSLDELAGYNVVTYRQHEGPFVDELAVTLEGHPYLQISQEFNDEITLGSVVSGNPDTVAIVCYNWLMTAFTNIALVEIEDAPVDFHRFYMCYRSNERKGPVIEKFIELAKKQEWGNVSPAPSPRALAELQRIRGGR